MKRTTLLLFALISCHLAFCQLTKVKSVDTIQVRGKVLYIDDISDMKVHITPGWFKYIPYYLILIEPDSLTAIKFNIPCRFVIRWYSNTDSIIINKTLTFIVRRTEYEKINIPFPGDAIQIQTATDSILKQINKADFVSSFLPTRPCYDYSLKDNPYFIYEQLDDRFK